MRFPSAVLRRMLMELLGEKTANHFAKRFVRPAACYTAAWRGAGNFPGNISQKSRELKIKSSTIGVLLGNFSDKIPRFSFSRKRHPDSVSLTLNACKHHTIQFESKNIVNLRKIRTSSFVA